MRLLNTIFVVAFCGATIILAILCAFEIQYNPKWEAVYTVTAFAAMLTMGLINLLVLWAQRRPSLQWRQKRPSL